MKLFIPEIGTVIKLSADWEFTLYKEGRNEALIDASNFPSNFETRETFYAAATKAGWNRKSDYSWNPGFNKRHTLPMGTILTVDRIYIRKGVSEYSSVSFNLKRDSVEPEFSDFARNINTQKGRCRFWAKLADVNDINFQLL